MWVPAVGPEEEQPVEQRLDVDHEGFPLWKDPEGAAVLLINNTNDTKINSELMVPSHAAVTQTRKRTDRSEVRVSRRP